MTLSLLLSCSGGFEKTYPQERLLVESVYASATVVPDSLYQAHSSVQGILDKNYVNEGELVKKDDPLLKIVNTTPLLTRENAALEMNLAKENYAGSAAVVNSILDEIDAAKVQLINDSINFVRQERLWNQNIGSKIEYDNRKMAYDLSRNRVASLERKYERTQNELRTRLKQAQNSYRSATTITKDYIIRSKIDGRVYALYRNPGELVNTLEPVAAIGHSENFIIELIIDEVDVVKLEIDQKMVITLDAYPNQVFDAKLTKIYPKKEEKNQTFKAEATFIDYPPKLYSGLAGEANIIISKKDNALTIPRDYLLPNNEVMTQEGKISVAVGLQNLGYVEITNGLTADT
ncbi:MAG: HlyD family efflux transporter periplasmic adaptor subunit, partial [Kangiellaceae bacterium]|nr:HlyD family efflux transporter periplasmic adaptor subunit [Kangiellaceae bacterium]